MRTPIISIIAAFVLVNSCITNEKKAEKMVDTQAPMAEKVPHELEKHGDVRVDEYYWLKLSDEQKLAQEPDEQTKKVVDYLNAENDYTKEVMSHTEKFQKDLFDEIVGRIDQTDQSVPVKVNGYWYYSRYEEGQDYPFYCRKEGSLDSEEAIMLNGPELAKEHAYFAIGGRSVSEDNKLLVYGVDTVSRRQYTLYVKNLETGETLSDKIENTTGGATWANDNKTLFYTVKD
ncbi:MAG: oligopeptidase B, partial [Flavobacteriales bacterium]|nr:oligopeptidase B [Flavobacteriales bacterium]